MNFFDLTHKVTNYLFNRFITGQHNDAHVQGSSHGPKYFNRTSCRHHIRTNNVALIVIKTDIILVSI